jgi:hypothetical protein
MATEKQLDALRVFEKFGKLTPGLFGEKMHYARSCRFWLTCGSVCMRLWDKGWLVRSGICTYELSEAGRKVLEESR